MIGRSSYGQGKRPFGRPGSGSGRVTAPWATERSGHGFQNVDFIDGKMAEEKVDESIHLDSASTISNIRVRAPRLLPVTDFLASWRPAG